MISSVLVTSTSLVSVSAPYLRYFIFSAKLFYYKISKKLNKIDFLTPEHERIPLIYSIDD